MMHLKEISNLQLGILLTGSAVLDCVCGGPGYNSNSLAQGDVILKIDGQNVNAANIHAALIGNDMPGSPVVVMAAKGGPQVSFSKLQIV